MSFPMSFPVSQEMTRAPTRRHNTNSRTTHDQTQYSLLEQSKGNTPGQWPRGELNPVQRIMSVYCSTSLLLPLADSVHNVYLGCHGPNLVVVQSCSLPQADHKNTNSPGQGPNGVLDPEQQILSETSYRYPVVFCSILST